VIRSTIAVLFLILPLAAYALPNDKCQDARESRQEAIFSGRISTDSVERFTRDYENCPPSVIVITSTGGDAEAAMALGDWIFKNGIDIKIPFLCMSSCANYVFPAAKNKFIGSKGLVVWHGSALQKNFRDFMEKYERFEQANEDRPFIDANALKYQGLKRIVKVQREFYARIGVDEAIDRLGQEPVDYGVSGWATTLAVMQKHGIRNVEAATNYAEASYLRTLPNLNVFFKGKFMSFGFDASGRLMPIMLESTSP
jgi:hypothetical protein